MANYKKEIEKRIKGPDIVPDGSPMAFDGTDGKTAKVLPDGGLSVEKIEPLDEQKVVVTETDGTLATSDISTQELGYLRGLTQSIIDTIYDIVNGIPQVYPVTVGYGGNAGSGRYLEKFSGIDTTEAPDVVPADGNIIGLTIGCKDTTGDLQIGIYKTTDLVNPIFVYDLVSGVQSNYILGLNIPIVAGDLLAVKIIAGARTKPVVTYFVSTNNL